MGMRVVADFGRADAQISTLQRVVRWLTKFAPALIGAGAVGWLLLLVIILRDDARLAIGLVSLVTVVTLTAVAVPHWVEGFSAEIRQHTQKRTAQAELTNTLETYLDDGWTLYHDVPVNDTTVSILTGTRGVYLLDLLFSEQAGQVKADKWLFRDEDGDWELSDNSPSRQARTKATQLQQQLETALPIRPRVVWAGSAVILLDEPKTPVWWLAQPEVMLRDLRARDEAVSAETLTQLNEKLEKLIEPTNANALFSM